MKPKNTLHKQPSFNTETSEISHTKAEEEQVQVKYADLARLLEGGDTRKFQQLAGNVDLNDLQNNNKPFIFYAIERDDKNMVKSILEFDVQLDARYVIEMQSEEKSLELSHSDLSNTLGRRKSLFDSSFSGGTQKTRDAKARASIANTFTPSTESERSVILQRHECNAIEYAKLLNRSEIVDIIHAKLREAPIVERWIKIVDNKDLSEIRKFKERTKSLLKLREMLQLGLIRAAQKGFISLIEYFLNYEKVNVNCQTIIGNGVRVTPLLQAISYCKNEAAKHLVYRGADVHMVGQYGDALITALHYDMPPDLIQLLLDKGASLASRHKDWPALSIRDFCVQFSRVKAKLIIDEHVCKFIADGEYDKLKYLTDNGFKHLNVRNRLKKYGRQIAVERHHKNIVDLIDYIEQTEYRLWIKMNYKN